MRASFQQIGNGRVPFGVIFIPIAGVLDVVRKLSSDSHRLLSPQFLLDKSQIDEWVIEIIDDRFLDLKMNRANPRSLCGILVDVGMHRVGTCHSGIIAKGKTVQPGVKLHILGGCAVLTAIDDGRTTVGVGGMALTEPVIETHSSTSAVLDARRFRATGSR